MEIGFDVGGSRARFARDWFWGKATMEADGESVTLQDPMNFGTHFGFELSRTYNARIQDCDVVVVHQRPRLFAGFRPHYYRVFVDEEMVAESQGF